MSSQQDTEQAELARERGELKNQPEAEFEELANIYIKRGVAKDVAHSSSTYFGTHLCLRHIHAIVGCTHLSSAALVYAIAISTLLFLAVLGAIGSRIGGSSILRGALRVTFWGALALALTAAIGAFVGRIV